MGNPVKGDQQLKLKDGRAYTLRLDFDALVRAETVYDKPLKVLMAHAAQERMGAMQALVLGALHAHHPEVEAPEVGKMLMTEPDAVALALGECAKLAFPDAEDGAPPAGEGEESPNPTTDGNSSGRSGANKAATRKPSGTKRRARSR